MQKYKSARYGGVRGNLSEADACWVVVQALWEFHLFEGRNAGDASLRPGVENFFYDIALNFGLQT